VLQTDDRRQTTDGRAIAYSERERSLKTTCNSGDRQLKNAGGLAHLFNARFVRVVQRPRLHVLWDQSTADLRNLFPVLKYSQR